MTNVSLLSLSIFRIAEHFIKYKYYYVYIYNYEYIYV